MSAAQIVPQTLLARAPAAIAVAVAGTTVLHDPVHDRYIRLNSVGAYLWRRLENPRSIGALAEGLAERHGIDPDVAQRDVAVFAADLLERGVIELGDVGS